MFPRPFRLVPTIVLVLFLVLPSASSFRAAEPTPSAPSAPLPAGLYAEVTTPRGIIVSELFYKKAPMTCANFVGLAEGTLGPAPRKPFYDGLTFHRVVAGFVVQGGDPRGNGNGDAGYEFPDEIVTGLRHDSVGVMQMANEGPDSNGSQFCFMLKPSPHLDYAHTIFGHAIRGLDVLPLIQQGDTMQVKILRIGPDAQSFRADEKSFASLVSRAPRLAPSHFDDADGVLPADAPWRAKYAETMLANLRRFTGGLAYVRLREKLAVEFPDQTMQQSADAYRARLSLPQQAVLAVYYAAEDQWVLATGGRPDIKLPDGKHRKGPPPAADQIEAMVKERKRIAASVVEVINGLIIQFEPK